MPSSRAARHVLGALLALVTALGVLVTAPDARADDEAARAHFKRGVELYDKKQYEPALAAFRAAYSEKASPGIKQNIALCLKGLGKPVEAATSFDEALDEGRDVLKPEVRAAIEHELAELTKVVGTITLKVVALPERKPVESVTITVDGKALSPAALRRPIRLEPGIHVFRAQALGYSDPPEKKLSILAGSPVDAAFEVSAPGGTLIIRPNVPEARVRIDGVEYPPGGFEGRVTDGPHRVEIYAAGYQPMVFEAVVTSGATVEYPIGLIPGGPGVPEPPAYEAPSRKPPPKPKYFYVAPMVAGSGESLRFAPVMGEPVGGTRRSLSGAAVGVRGGYRFSRFFAVEIMGEVGRLSTKYRLTDSSTIAESETGVTHWSVMPMLRFATVGSVRFIAGTGIGLQGRSIEAKLEIPTTTSSSPNVVPTRTTAVTKTGDGLGATWMVDAGIQFDVSSVVFLEALGVLDLHGVGAARDDDTSQRLFLGSPALRGGLRVGLGIQF